MNPQQPWPQYQGYPPPYPMPYPPQDIIPTPVRVGLLTLQGLWLKEAPLLASNDVGFDQLVAEEGMKLTCEEDECKVAALAMLTRYFEINTP